MTGKRYYISTLRDWQRHAARFSNSHWFALPPADNANPPARSMASDDGPAENPRILVLVEADEGAHLALEDDTAFEPLPHPLAQKAISAAAREALANLGVPSGATTFDVAEALARFHPLLRHRVF
jgi:hypothetical protein